MLSVIETLRDAIVGGKSLKKNDEADTLVVNDGEYSFPLDTTTNFKASTGKGGFYSLKSIYFLYEQRDKPYSEYLGLCVRDKVPKVSILDRKEILGYLRGEIETSSRLVSLMEVPVSQDAASVVKKDIDGIAETRIDFFKGIEDYVDEVNLKGMMEGREAISAAVDGLIRKVGVPFEEELKYSQIGANDGSLFKEAEGFISSEKLITNRINDGEFRVSTHNTILRGSKERNFQYILVELEEDRIKGEKRRFSERRHGETDRGRWSRPGGGSVKRGVLDKSIQGTSILRDTAATARSRGKSHSSRRRKMTPIIVVPTAATSLINIYNAKEFLENAVFCSKEEMKRKIHSRDEISFIQRKSTRVGVTQESKYEVVDIVSKLPTDDWERVVAVFVTGKKWQFADWPWKTPADVFAHTAGFYLCQEGDKIPETINSWNVNVLRIDAAKRHLDLVAARKFWSVIDTKLAPIKKNIRF